MSEAGNIAEPACLGRRAAPSPLERAGGVVWPPNLVHVEGAAISNAPPGTVPRLTHTAALRACARYALKQEVGERAAGWATRQAAEAFSSASMAEAKASRVKATSSAVWASET